MGNGGIVELTIPQEKLKDVIKFLHHTVQRIFPVDFDPCSPAPAKAGVYQLDSRNDWHLVDRGQSLYNLGARYEHQSVVDAISTVVRWHFQLDGYLTQGGEPAHTIQGWIKRTPNASQAPKAKERTKQIVDDLLSPRGNNKS